MKQGPVADATGDGFVKTESRLACQRGTGSEEGTEMQAPRITQPPPLTEDDMARIHMQLFNAIAAAVYGPTGALRDGPPMTAQSIADAKAARDAERRRVFEQTDVLIDDDGRTLDAAKDAR